MRTGWCILVGNALFTVALVFSHTVAARQENALATYPRNEWGSIRSLLRESPTLLPAAWKSHIKLVPPPPLKFQKLELEKLRKKVGHRVDKLAAIIDQDRDMVPSFLRRLGASQRELPATGILIATVGRDASIVVMHFKNKFKRVRPWHVDSELGEVITRPRHPSYPSGHAMQSVVIALSLADALHSSCRSTLFSVASEIGENREIAGVHFESDTDAGKTLGFATYQLLNRSETFRMLVEAAKEELINVRCN